jgi:hypothetical protein
MNVMDKDKKKSQSSDYWITMLSQQAFYTLQHINQTISSHVKHFTGNLNLNFKFTEILEHWVMQTVYLSPQKYISKSYILRSTVWSESACCSDKQNHKLSHNKVSGTSSPCYTNFIITHTLFSLE